MKPGALIAGVLLSFAACGTKPVVDAGTCDGGLTFGATCTQACECASSVCFQFGSGFSACTVACTSNTDCPSGSQGQKCNGQGMCRP